MNKVIHTCPLCEDESVYNYSSSHGNKVKNINCPTCKKLVFEDGTEDKVSSFHLDSKKEAIAMAKSMTNKQVMYFAWNHKKKNMQGESDVISSVIDPSSL